MKRIIIAACLLWGASALGQGISPSGGGGTPGGLSGQIQYNNAGAFGGFTMGGDCTFSQPNITCTSINSKAVTLGAALTTTGAGAPTLAFPANPHSYTFQDAAYTVIGRDTTDTLTNKTYDTAGTGNSFSINGVAATANTGTGSVVRATSPALVTPALGIATATSIAIGGCTIGGNALCITGSTLFPGSTSIDASGNIIAQQQIVAESSGLAVRIQLGASLPGGVKMGSTTIMGWLSTSGSANGTVDTVLSRDSAGVVDVGTNTQGSTAGSMKMTGITASGAAVVFSGLTTGTNADFVCYKSDGTLLIQNSACTISSLRFKPDWKPYQGDALATLAALEVGTFHTAGENRDPNAHNLQVGLNAESVARTEPLAAVYEDDGVTPKSYRQEALIALLVAGMRELKADNDNLRRRLDPR